VLHHLHFPCYNYEECVYIWVDKRIFLTVFILYIFMTKKFFGVGAIHFFQKMNIGPLKIGDFLGIVIITLCIRTILHSVFSQHTLPSYLLTHSIDCSNWSDIFCNRFCLHLAGINGNEAVVLARTTCERDASETINPFCLCRCSIRTRHLCYTAWFSEKA
jgi:hypothetical protein